MRRRMQFVNAELLESTLNSGRSVIMMLGHYGNWEYISSISLWINTPNTRLGQIYRPLKNEWFDRLFLKIRSRFGLTCIPQSRYAALPPVGTRIGQTIGNRIHFGSNAITCQYTSLDNVPQPRYSGIHRRRNYCQKTRHRRHVLRRRSHKRGYYRATIREIELDPRTRPDFEITDRYIGLMEQTILRAPEYWLWTHNRWKHQHL